MIKYSKEELRRIFQAPFDREAWKAIVVDIFGANKIRRENELLTDPDDPEVGYYMGSIDTPDSYKIGLFYYKVNSGSVVHKKVGLRNLVKKFINQNSGIFDAALVVFNSDPEWRLSFICDIKEEATAPKRFTFVFGEADNLYRTAIERFEKLQTEKSTFENIKDAFSVDALSDDFFNQYRELYADFVEYITGKRYVKEGGKWVEKVLGRPNHQFATTFEKDDKLVRDYIKKMFGRIVFLYFLQRKGWLNNNRNYMHDLFANSDKRDNFLDGVLEPLFFKVLNTDKPNRSASAKRLPGVDNIPYLNGGLFASDEIDDRTCVFPEGYFKQLFDFLDSYNFTIDENDTDDSEIGIDPEMLGRIFENLLEDNKDKGAFYTPKEIVNYMCRESIIAYLISAQPKIDEKAIRMLVEQLDASQLSESQKKDIRKSLQSVKICDPAIGSGAFPMGLVNILSKLYVVMKVDTDTKTMKRHIMEQNIYGVDIEKGAVDIARLRFWLAMIVEEKEPMPLPNLHFKIMQGNSLLESYNGIDLSDLTKLDGERGIFDYDNTGREDLINALKKYYRTADHEERGRLFNVIVSNVRRQLLDKQVVLPSGMDPSANTEFFLWHTWFADVFEKGGFDIVIGNPPYVTNLKSDEKLRLSKIYPEAKKKIFDLYNFFMIFIHNILSFNSGITSMIVPPTWLTNDNSSKLRKYLAKNGLYQINYFKENVFQNAVVNSCICFTSSAASKNYIICHSSRIENNKVKTTITHQIEVDQIKSVGAIIPLEKGNGLLEIIKNRVDTIPLGDIAKIVFGIQDRKSSSDPSYITNTKIDSNHKKVLNGKHINRYSIKDSGIYINYGKWLWNPRNPEIFEAKEKILVRQVGKYPICCYDNQKFYTLNTIYNVVIINQNYGAKFVLAILNSRLMQHLWKEIYPEQKDVFPRLKKEQLVKIPIPKLNKKCQTILEYLVDKILVCDDNEVKSLDFIIDLVVYKFYCLTYDDVIMIEPKIPILREEYESFNWENINLTNP